ncbi:MAG: UMP kinase [Flavobacteriales bacterium]|nr:UMP kinase [Flavobacteriales bacterium]|tara:strand:+ start:3558 stop:4265 length:708 start_codon:yes stop_codon:yes gene_type:complete
MIYRRVLLKLSGESLAGKKDFGISNDKLSDYAYEIKSIVDQKVEVALVVGGGNIFRGIDAVKDVVDRVQGDHMGMLATVINGLALQSALEKLNIQTRLMSAVKIDEIAEPFIRRRAVRHLEKGRVVIFVAGTGRPYFTTDTAAVLRAVEIKADIIIKGTRVDGVFSSDPEINKDAKKFEKISFDEIYKHKLSVMDMTAFTLCKENNLPISIFNVNKAGNLLKLIQGDNIGTKVYM